MSIVTKKNGPKKGAPVVYTWLDPKLKERCYSTVPPGCAGLALVNPYPERVGRPSYDTSHRRVPKRLATIAEKPSNDILRALARAHAGL